MPILSSRPRILFLSTDLNPYGGGEAVASWILQAMAPVCDVTILCWNAPDLAALDCKFGTALAGYQFPLILPGAAARFLISKISDHSNFQRVNYLLRLLKRIRQGYDAVVCSCSMECDLGGPAIQYINFPYLAPKFRPLTVPGDTPLAASLGALLDGRQQLWMRISGFSVARMRSNLTLTNSHWAKALIYRELNLQCEVLYPPVEGERFHTPWEQRENGFVTVGRLVADKRQDWILETLALVRQQQPDLRLHICGSQADARYLRRLQAMAADHGDWVEIHLNLPKQELMTLTGRQRYGMHAYIEEHFGIAPAEMACAGTIPFVHNSGGQVEIVNADPRLCYTGQQDAVARILAVMASPSQQEQLRQMVHARSKDFSAQAFQRNFQLRLEQFLAQR